MTTATPLCPACKKSPLSFTGINKMGCRQCGKESSPPPGFENKGSLSAAINWKRIWDSDAYLKKVENKLGRIKKYETKRLIAVGNELSILSPRVASFQDFQRPPFNGDSFGYIGSHLGDQFNILTVLRLWENKSGSPKRMPALKLQVVNRLLSPLQLPENQLVPGVDFDLTKKLDKELDDRLKSQGKDPKKERAQGNESLPILSEQAKRLRFEDARIIKEAVQTAIHGPGTIDDLMDDIIVHFHDITPHGKRTEAIAAALDQRNIPNQYEKSWSAALQDKSLKHTVMSLINARHKRATRP